jgi:UDP-N-acetylmuramoyl-L-alanyl-D-glutamate--2,6-diaminopimelate ligase
MASARRPALVPRPAPPPEPYLVAGLGRAGQAAAGALAQLAGPERVVCWERSITRATRRVARALERRGVRVHLSAELPLGAGPHGPRTLIRSPGISMESQPMREAREAGLEVMDELELGWRLSRAPMIAVTGTNGKSTITALATGLLSAAGRRVRLTGNTDFGEPLCAVAHEPLDWLVCEVSSYQLEGCPSLLPEIAVFTNLTLEHLSRHGTMERYGRAKRRLFIRDDVAAPRAIVDIDDTFGEQLAIDAERWGGAVDRVGFSPKADYRILSAAWDLRQASVRLVTPTGETEVKTRLPGAYNARNVAAAVALADALAVEPAVTAAALAVQPAPPGRFEHIDEGQEFAAIVDFAHTPDGLCQFLQAVRAGLPPGGRVRSVYGAAGRETKHHLRECGRVLSAGSDDLFLTKSGYRGEPPMRPLQGHLEGARAAAGAQLEIVLDRRRAIERALSAARPGDAVVVVGRGAVPTLTPDLRGVPFPFDDRVVVRELLRERRRG